jgi:aminopeptidase N
VAATVGDNALWDRYVARMQQAQATDAQEEARFRQALVYFEDPELAQRTAEAVFSSIIRVQDRGLMLGPMIASRRTRLAAWNAVKAHWDADIAGTDLAPLLKQGYVNAVSQLAQRGLSDEAAKFLETKRTPDIQETVAQSLERLRINTAAAERLADELEDALKVATPG